MSWAGFQGDLTTQSSSLRLTQKTLCSDFPISIVNRAAPILAMFKRIFESLGFKTFELSSEKIELEAENL